MIKLIIIVTLGFIAVLLVYNFTTHWSIISSILNRDMSVYTMTLNIIEDHKGTLWAKENKQRIEWINSYAGSITFLPGVYIRCKPILLEKWYNDEVILVRVDKNFHSQSDKSGHLSITRECRFITYHNRLWNTDVQYTQMKVLVFDCSTVVDGLNQLMEKIYKRTSVPILLVGRTIQRAHLYHESRLICIADSQDFGFTDFLDLCDEARNLH